MEICIDRSELKRLLLEEGYIEENGIEITLDNLLNLKGVAANMLCEWVKTGKVHKFDPIEGFDRNFLRNEMKMKDPAIILAYGMLIDNPKYNAMMLRRMHSNQLKASFNPREANFNPWGYTDNPLEIDSRYASDTVVKNITNDLTKSE